MLEHQEAFYITTIGRSYKINRTIATFLRLLAEPRTAKELVTDVQHLTAAPDPAAIRAVVDKFLRDMYRLEIVRREGDVDVATLHQHYQAGDLVGRYRIGALLSLDDQFVQVYKATNCETDQPVVLKMFSHRPEAVTDSKTLAKGLRQFQQEFELMGSLPPHPNVCALHSYHPEPYPHAVLEYLRGCTVSQGLTQNLFREADKPQLVAQMLRGLAHVHAHGIIHGDIHPRNFMVDGERVCLIDFGFAHRRGVTEEHQVINRGGAACYLPPERVNQHHYKFSKRAADFRSEVYQVGLVIYKLCYGQVPFEGGTWLELAASITSHNFGQRLSAAVPHERVLLRALHQNPAERYSDAAELLTAWQQATEQPVATAPVG
ncbi:protein kinase domain-containing protein [Hymenobacter luteus]